MAENNFDTEAVATRADFLTEFGESVVYYAGGSGDGRSITAIIDRSEIAALDAGPQGHSYRIRVDVINDATDGISAAEVDTGKDTISIAVRAGANVKTRRITKIIAQNAAWLRLEVR